MALDDLGTNPRRPQVAERAAVVTERAATGKEAEGMGMAVTAKEVEEMEEAVMGRVAAATAEVEMGMVAAAMVREGRVMVKHHLTGTRS